HTRFSRDWSSDVCSSDLEILNMTPPQIVAAWQRGDIDAAYVWPPALSEILKTGKEIANSEEIGAKSVPTFDGLVVDKSFASENRSEERRVGKEGRSRRWQ